MEYLTPEPEIIYQNLIEIPCRAFLIYHDLITGEWYAEHPDEDRFDDNIIIQDKDHPFVDNTELFDGYILTREEFDRFQKIVKELYE